MVRRETRILAVSSLDPGASRSRQQPQETNERRLTGSVMVRQRDSWGSLLEYQYSSVTLPQARVFCRENGAHLKHALSAEFFTELLSVRGFEVTVTGSTSFMAQRK